MNIPEEAPPRRLRGLPSRLANQAALTANRIVDRALAQAGVRRYHYALLATLEEYGPASQAGLVRRTGIDRSDMVAVVNDLAGRDCLERAPDPEDRRRNIITITPVGRGQLVELDQLIAAAQEEFLAPLPPADREHLIDLLTRLVEPGDGRRQEIGSVR
ncbi:MarR family winged helix-turn-helix transcriptional regulator [Nonomuraea bangladeshensis]|uniref:MarR family winged helix-turn-helix transcriptional regulator n=1 Tax=Nonomuraea bangladeshensis TaxID=404385 RepID=UPI003C2B4D4C